jgi:hypothetical protein
MAQLLSDVAEEEQQRTSLAFSIDGAGAPRSIVRDSHTQTFILFAPVCLYRLTAIPRLSVTSIARSASWTLN